MPPSENQRFASAKWGPTDPAIDSVAISVGGGDQTLSTPGRYLYVQGAGNVVCQLVNSAADVTFTGLLAGTVYPFAIKLIRQTGTTITGNVLL